MCRRVFVGALVALFAAAAPAAAEVPEALGEEVRPIVETGLASEDAAVRSWALRAAALLDGDTFEDQLVAGLENVEPAVRIASARALLSIDEETRAAEAVLVTELVEGGTATRGLLLENILLSLGEDVRVRTIERAIDASEDADLTRQLVVHVAQRGEGELYELLERCAELDDPAARAVYVDAIIAAGREEGLDVARALLAEDDGAKRLEGAEIAFALNSVAARELLEPLLDDDDAALAQRAGAHLARYGNAAALRLAADLALNPDMDEALRMDAMALLRDNGPQMVSWAALQTVLDEDGRSMAFKTRVYELAGATNDPDARAALLELLNGLFADERLYGLAGYGYAGQDDGVATFSETLAGAGDQALRLAAAEALGNHGGSLAADALVTALRTERVDEVKVAIVRALGKVEGEGVSQAIANTLVQPNEELALAALDALAGIGDASIAPQIESAALAARSPAVRWRATVVLTQLDPELGRIRLLQALDRPPAGFMDDIADLPQSILDEVDQRLLRHAERTLREAALFRVMGAEDRGYSVLRPFVDAASSPDVRRQAIAVVTAAGRAEDAEVFQTLSTDTDRSIRLQGFAALASLGDPANDETFRGYLSHADVALRMIAVYGLLSSAS